MTMSWPFKDPGEVLDYQLNWTSRLAGDTIATSTWVIPAELTKVIDSNTETTTTVWLSGGTLSTWPDVTNHIVTSSGRTMYQTVSLPIRAK